MITQRFGTEMGLMASRVRRKFRNGAFKVSGLQSNVTSKGKKYIRHTDYLVHENAWKLMGVTAALAVVTGFLLARRYATTLVDTERTVLVHDSGDEREVKVKSRSNMDLLKALLPFALFFVRARKEAKCAKTVKVKAS